MPIPRQSQICAGACGIPVAYSHGKGFWNVACVFDVDCLGGGGAGVYVSNGKRGSVLGATAVSIYSYVYGVYSSAEGNDLVGA